MKVLSMLFFLGACGSLWSQNAFYVQLLDEGKHFMALEDFDHASQYLEIAAFGLLDHQDLWREASVRRLFCLAMLDHDDSVTSLTVTLKSWIPENAQKPSGLDLPLWQAYRTYAGNNTSFDPSLVTDDQATEFLLKLNPNIPALWAARLKTLSADQQADAEAWIQRGMAFAGQDMVFLDACARWYYTMSQLEKADSIADRMLTLDPNNELAHEIKALEAESRGRKSQAQKHRTFVQNGQLQPYTAEDGTGEPEIPQSVIEENTDQAKPKTHRALEKMLKSDPANLDLRAALVGLYLDRNDLKKASKHLSILGQSDRTSLTYMGLFARFNYLSKNHETNLTLFDVPRRNDEIHYYLGKSCLALNLNDRALHTLKNLSPGYKEDVQALIDEARRRTEEEASPPDQRATLTRLVETGKATFVEQIDLGLSYIQANDWEDAKRYIQKLTKLYPKEPQVLYLAARVLIQEGKYAEAAKSLSGLANAGFHQHEVLYYGGLAYYRDGKKDHATYMFARALKSGTKYEAEIQSMLEGMHQ
ncbi:MAG: tetratricopeptide repeat protein [Acidobacteria bacterium]|nr:tetratricopeptide repeat protein [Acidobacteriota bacterium]